LASFSNFKFSNSTFVRFLVSSDWLISLLICILVEESGHCIKSFNLDCAIAKLTLACLRFIIASVVSSSAIKSHAFTSCHSFTRIFATLPFLRKNISRD
jgi:hypothetical protein